MDQPIKKVQKLKTFNKISTFSHRKKIDEKLIKKAEGAFKNFKLNKVATPSEIHTH